METDFNDYDNDYDNDDTPFISSDALISSSLGSDDMSYYTPNFIHSDPMYHFTPSFDPDSLAVLSLEDTSYMAGSAFNGGMNIGTFQQGEQVQDSKNNIRKIDNNNTMMNNNNNNNNNNAINNKQNPNNSYNNNNYYTNNNNNNMMNSNNMNHKQMMVKEEVIDDYSEERERDVKKRKKHSHSSAFINSNSPFIVNNSNSYTSRNPYSYNPNQHNTNSNNNDDNNNNNGSIFDSIITSSIFNNLTSAYSDYSGNNPPQIPQQPYPQQMYQQQQQQKPQPASNTTHNSKPLSTDQAQKPIPSRSSRQSNENHNTNHSSSSSGGSSSNKQKNSRDSMNVSGGNNSSGGNVNREGFYFTVERQPPVEVRTRTPSENRTFSVIVGLHNYTASSLPSPLTHIRARLIYSPTPASPHATPVTKKKRDVLSGDLLLPIPQSNSNNNGVILTPFTNLSISEASTKHGEKEYSIMFTGVMANGQELVENSIWTMGFYGYSHMKVLARRKNIVLRTLSKNYGSVKGGECMHVVGSPFVRGPSLRCVFDCGERGKLDGEELEVYSDSVLFFKSPRYIWDEDYGGGGGGSPANGEVSGEGGNGGGRVMGEVKIGVRVTNDGRTFSNALEFVYIPDVKNEHEAIWYQI